MNKKEQEMREEARERIIECLKNGYTGYYCDLHHEVFNTDYYIIGTERAKEALTEYGVWDAIEKVQTYEKDNFGEIYTDLSNPEKLINMLYYIIGEEVLFEMMDGIKVWDENWNNQADEETNSEILKAIEKYRHAQRWERARDRVVREIELIREPVVIYETGCEIVGVYATGADAADMLRRSDAEHWATEPSWDLAADVDYLDQYAELWQQYQDILRKEEEKQ